MGGGVEGGRRVCVWGLRVEGSEGYRKGKVRERAGTNCSEAEP